MVDKFHRREAAMVDKAAGQARRLRRSGSASGMKKKRNFFKVQLGPRSGGNFFFNRRLNRVEAAPPPLFVPL